MLQTLKSCPKCNKLPNMVTLLSIHRLLINSSHPCTISLSLSVSHLLSIFLSQIDLKSGSLSVSSERHCHLSLIVEKHSPCATHSLSLSPSFLLFYEKHFLFIISDHLIDENTNLQTQKCFQNCQIFILHKNKKIYNVTSLGYPALPGMIQNRY